MQKVRVERLTVESTGQWWVRTQESEHLFDLDRGLYERHHLDGMNAMRGDGQTLTLDKAHILQWPAVDNVFIIRYSLTLTDLTHPVFLTHRSSLIQFIEQVEGGRR